MKWCAENRKKLLFGQWMFLLNIVSSRRGGRNFRGWEKNCHCTFLHVLHPITNNRSVTVFFDVVFQNPEQHLKLAVPFIDVRPKVWSGVLYFRCSCFLPKVRIVREGKEKKNFTYKTQDLGGNPGWNRRHCLSIILQFQLSFVRFAEQSKSLALNEGGKMQC